MVIREKNIPSFIYLLLSTACNVKTGEMYKVQRGCGG